MTTMRMFVVLPEHSFLVRFTNSSQGSTGAVRCARSPRRRVAFSAAEAVRSRGASAGSIAVVKAQIPAGGRGKGGGVKIAKSPSEVEQLANQMLGMKIVTHQTAPRARKVGSAC